MSQRTLATILSRVLSVQTWVDRDLGCESFGQEDHEEVDFVMELPEGSTFRYFLTDLRLKLYLFRSGVSPELSLASDSGTKTENT